MKKYRVISVAAIKWIVVVSALMACGISAYANTASLPQDGEQTRKLWDSQFFKPTPKAISNKPAVPRRRYRIVTPGIFVTRVVHVKSPVKRIEQRTTRKRA